MCCFWFRLVYFYCCCSCRASVRYSLCLCLNHRHHVHIRECVYVYQCFVCGSQQKKTVSHAMRCFNRIFGNFPCIFYRRIYPFIRIGWCKIWQLGGHYVTRMCVTSYESYHYDDNYSAMHIILKIDMEMICNFHRNSSVLIYVFASNSVVVFLRLSRFASDHTWRVIMRMVWSTKNKNKKEYRRPAIVAIKMLCLLFLVMCIRRTTKIEWRCHAKKFVCLFNEINTNVWDM